MYSPMTKKKESDFSSIEDEVKFLRNQNTGLRGYNAQLQKKIMFLRLRVEVMEKERQEKKPFWKRIFGR